MPAVIILIVLIAADQLLKWWTVSHLALGESAPADPRRNPAHPPAQHRRRVVELFGRDRLLTAVTLVLMAARRRVAREEDRAPPSRRRGVPADSRRRARQHDRSRRARLRRRHV